MVALAAKLEVVMLEFVQVTRKFSKVKVADFIEVAHDKPMLPNPGMILKPDDDIQEMLEHFKTEIQRMLPRQEKIGVFITFLNASPAM